jgi:hypothetical protein
MATSQRTDGKTSGRQTKQRPVFCRKFFPVQVAVFEYENDGRLNHSVSLTRSFRRDADSEWENTPYLTVSDLLPAAKLLNDAYSVIHARLQQAFAGDRMSHGEIQDSLDQRLRSDDVSTPF